MIVTGLSGHGCRACELLTAQLQETTTHQILWDADGTGVGSARLLATLTGVATMSASDCQIV